MPVQQPTTIASTLGTQRQSQIISVTKEATMKAEILWSLKVTQSHYSYHSSEPNT